VCVCAGACFEDRNHDDPKQPTRLSITISQAELKKHLRVLRNINNIKKYFLRSVNDITRYFK